MLLRFFDFWVDCCAPYTLLCLILPSPMRLQLLCASLLACLLALDLVVPIDPPLFLAICETVKTKLPVAGAVGYLVAGVLG
jgi:hypothetical protein